MLRLLWRARVGDRGDATEQLFDAVRAASHLFPEDVLRAVAAGDVNHLGAPVDHGALHLDLDGGMAVEEGQEIRIRQLAAELVKQDVVLAAVSVKPLAVARGPDPVVVVAAAVAGLTRHAEGTDSKGGLSERAKVMRHCDPLCPTLVATESGSICIAVVSVSNRSRVCG